ncbi:mitochondrial import receptor protein [Mycoblastus sanguinarius]|nr:mitochondrial import receptor protein [Mycoblastus sanguinarius]
MVQLEEVEDPELDQAQPGPIPDSAYDSADFTDTESELSDDDTLTVSPSESLSDRIYALKDILPPRYRRAVTSTLSTSTSALKTGAWWGGKGLWVLSTGALMLMVPFAIAVVEEQQIIEQEKEIKAREGVGEVLTPGVGAGRGL